MEIEKTFNQTFRIYLDPSRVIKNKCLEIHQNYKVHMKIATKQKKYIYIYIT